MPTPAEALAKLQAIRRGRRPEAPIEIPLGQPRPGQDPEGARARIAQLKELQRLQREAIKTERRSPEGFARRVAPSAAAGAAAGAAVGRFMGGPGALAGAGLGGAAGAAEGTLGWGVEALTGREPLGQAAEFAAGPAAGVVRRIAGIPDDMARQAFQGVGLSDDAVYRAVRHGQGGPAVADIAQSGYQAARARTDEAYDAWRASIPQEVTVDPRGVYGRLQRSWAQEAPRGTPMPPEAARLAGDPEPMGIEELERLRSEIVGLGRKASRAGDEPLARRARQMAKEFDEIEDRMVELAERARPAGMPDPMPGAPAVEPQGDPRDLLRAARKARRDQGYIEKGLGFDRQVFDTLIDPRRSRDEAQRAVAAILRSPRPGEALNQLRQTAASTGRREELQHALTGTYLDYLTSRTASAMGGVPHKAPTLSDRISASRVAGREILGERAFKNLEALAKKVAKGEGAQEIDPTVRPKLNPGMLAVLATAMPGSVGYAGSQDPMVAGISTAIGGAGIGLYYIAQQFSPHVARKLALRSLVEPSLMKKLTKKAGREEGKALARSTMEWAVRRGLVRATDFVPEIEAPEGGE